MPTLPKFKKLECDFLVMFVPLLIRHNGLPSSVMPYGCTDTLTSFGDISTLPIEKRFRYKFVNIFFLWPWTPKWEWTLYVWRKGIHACWSPFLRRAWDAYHKLCTFGVSHSWWAPPYILEKGGLRNLELQTPDRRILGIIWATICFPDNETDLINFNITGHRARESRKEFN